MKKLLKSDNSITFDIIVNVDHPIFHLDSSDVAASSDLSKFNLPEGPVISKYKDKVTTEMVADFDAFMEDVECLCEINYGLIGTYKNVSDDHSYYYNYLATDEDGNIILRFRLRLRISNHSPKRSTAQKEYKKEEIESEKLRELLSEEEIKNLRTYTKLIYVNDERFSSYLEAMEYIDNTMEEIVEIMKKNSKYSKRKIVPDKYKNAKGFDYISDEAETKKN